MKRKVFTGIVAITFTTIAGFNVISNNQDNKLVGLSPGNVEALAQGEAGFDVGNYYIIMSL